LLSYRHSFHAGNFADLLKHIVLVEILEHLTQKDSAFEYIDTHAGAGLYNLKSVNSQKLQEYTNGIGKINADEFPELARYFDVIASFNPPNKLDFYPGSPSIASRFLRQQDRSWLYELHPQDFNLLRTNISRKRNIRVHFEDGFNGLKAILPPTSRRAVVLIDPSYEIKSDYRLVVERIEDAYNTFSQGVYAIWYPVVDRRVIDNMERAIKRTGIRNIQRFELGICADSGERGMTSSGMIVINPPWKLHNTMSALLPKLAAKVSESDALFYRCDVLVEE